MKTDEKKNEKEKENDDDNTHAGDNDDDDHDENAGETKGKRERERETRRENKQVIRAVQRWHSPFNNPGRRTAHYGGPVMVHLENTASGPADE